MSVRRTVAVIEYLAGSGPTSMRALARALDLPVGSAHRLMSALADEGVVERTASDEWRLTYWLVGLAGRQLGRTELPALARPVLEHLAGRSGQTAFLATRSGRDVVYLDKVQSAAQVQLYVELGTRRPVHCTGLGKAILAHLPDGQRDEAIGPGPLVRLTDRTITDPAVLRRELDEVRARGFATDRGEVADGINCLAAPVFDHANAVVGAVSLAGPDPRLGAGEGDLARLVVAGAATVSRDLGHV